MLQRVLASVPRRRGAGFGSVLGDARRGTDMVTPACQAMDVPTMAPFHTSVGAPKARGAAVQPAELPRFHAASTAAPASDVRHFTTTRAAATASSEESVANLYGPGEADKPARSAPVTTRTLAKMHASGQPISMVTAYDYPTIKLAESAGVDMVLVGDSVGNVVLGYDDTVSVTMEDMLHHCRAVMRGADTCFVVGDMPFGSYLNPAAAVENGVRFLKEGRVHAVKLEGGVSVVPQVKALTEAGVAVVGHIGLTPQSVSALGGYAVHGKSAEAAKSLLEDARALQKAGAMAIVMEMVPAELAELITSELDVPTIGIGAGNATSGQVLVMHDLLGLYHGHVPKFVKQYSSLAGDATAALKEYVAEVNTRSFPAKEHSYKMPAKALREIRTHLGLAETEEPASAAKTPTKGRVFATKGTSQSPASCTQSYFQAGGAGYVAGEPLRRKKVVVVGGGAMGSLFSAALSHSHDVSIVTSWAEHGEAVSTRGLQLLTPGEGDSFNTIGSTSPLQVLPTESVLAGDIGHDFNADVAIVLVKGHQTAVAAQVAHRLVANDGITLTLQNGATHLERLQAVLGADRVLYGVTAHGAHLPAAGSVAHAGKGPTKIVAPAAHLLSQADDMAALLSGAGIDTISLDPASLPAVLVEKLTMNACINPLTAVLGASNGTILENPWALNMLSQLHSEITKSAQGLQAPLASILDAGGDEADSDRASDLAGLVPALGRVEDVIEATRKNTSSMLADVRRGQVTEIDFINGIFCQAARAANVDVPVNDSFVQLLGAGRA